MNNTDDKQALRKANALDGAVPDPEYAHPEPWTPTLSGRLFRTTEAPNGDSSDGHAIPGE